MLHGPTVPSLNFCAIVFLHGPLLIPGETISGRQKGRLRSCLPEAVRIALLVHERSTPWGARLFCVDQLESSDVSGNRYISQKMRYGYVHAGPLGPTLAYIPRLASKLNPFAFPRAVGQGRSMWQGCPRPCCKAGAALPPPPGGLHPPVLLLIRVPQAASYSFP